MRTEQVRRLKVEPDGNGWRAIVKPKIRLKGRWLERAGFKPGSQVLIRSVSPGVLELRSPVEATPAISES